MVLHDTKKRVFCVGSFESANYVFAYVDDVLTFESANCRRVFVLILGAKQQTLLVLLHRNIQSRAHASFEGR